MFCLICTREKHPWTSDTFKKSTFNKSNTPLWVFFTSLYIFLLLYFTFRFIINNAKPTCLLFKITWLVWNRTKYHMLDNWSKQCTLEVSVIATELVSSTILFPTKKCLWNENVKTFQRYLFKALLCILFKLNEVSFHTLVWPVWLMLHNFVIILMSLPFDRRR